MVRLVDDSGFVTLPGYLGVDDQRDLLASLGERIQKAPFYRPLMPRTGKPLSVQMSNCGPLGWVSDQGRGYRYQATHPETGDNWPPIPDQLLKLWTDITGCAKDPEACLINGYGNSARMGLHKDCDEEDLEAPVLSISLGADALFRLGGATRSDKTRSFWLSSGDIVVLSGASRNFYHGIDRLRSSNKSVLTGSVFEALNFARINVTLRRVTL